MMSEKKYPLGDRCVIIGASHGGVNAAFALRQFGWKGVIEVYDASLAFPHQKPPLSKDYLSGKFPERMLKLKAEQAFEKAEITLKLGHGIEKIDRAQKKIYTNTNGIKYDKLVIATGADAFIPAFPGMEQSQNVFIIRHLPDAEKLKSCVDGFIAKNVTPNVVIVGAGYIGLEAAASLSKLGAAVTVLEKESRVLSRVTAAAMSEFFTTLHTEEGVKIITKAAVAAISQKKDGQVVVCKNGNEYPADIIIVGVGVRVNQSLAEEAGLTIEDGICVNSQCQTSDPEIYAIGDCTYHYNPIYDRKVRLESVQNAMDQANVAAMHICGRETTYDKVPWFWSDQFGLKLQIVGLQEGYNDLVIRRDKNDKNSISIWYFDQDRLIAVDAVNQPKSYMMGMKLIPKKANLDKKKLASLTAITKPEEVLLEGVK